MPGAAVWSIAHAAESELDTSGARGADAWVLVVAGDAGSVHGGDPTALMVFRTSAPLAPMATPWWDPEAGQSWSKTSVTPSPMRYEPSPTSTFLVLFEPEPPKR